jgi:hypothetical protein
VKKNTKNIAAVAILGLAVGAFVVDRFVLGYGGPASAAAAVEASADLPSSPSKPAAANVAASSGPSVAQRIASLRTRLTTLPESENADAFVIPTVWREEIRAAAPAAPANAASPHAADPKEPEGPKLVLTAVMTNRDATRSAATINGVVVQIGEMYKGFMLISVDKTTPASATLQGPDGQFVLRTKQEDVLNAVEAREGKPLVRTHYRN